MARPEWPACGRAAFEVARSPWQKSWPRAWTPVKYAKFFAERYVAQEIALF
jgi:hypothetical protein